jgi:hypothetical protein
MLTPNRLSRTLLAALAALTAGAALAQGPSADEAAAYHAWYAASTAKDAAKAQQAAQAYLKQFPKGQYAEYLVKWMAGEQARALNAAIQAKNTVEMLRIGKELLAGDAQNLNILYALAFNLRSNELLASPAVFTHAAEAADFATRAIALIEGGKAPAGVDPAQWKAQDALAWLHQTVAVAKAQAGDAEQALQHYAKSSALDSDNVSLNLHNSFGCGSLRKDRYDAAVKAFQTLPKPSGDGAEPTEEMKAALEKANAEADAAIDCWARFAGLARARKLATGTVQQVEKVLQTLYAYRHPGDADGLQQLIDKHAAAAPPSAAR